MRKFPFLLILSLFVTCISSVSSHAQMIFTKAGGGNRFGDYEMATTAWLYTPRSVALDSKGNLFVVDEENRRIRKINASTGIITTIAGGGTKAAGESPKASDSYLLQPTTIAIDPADNLYFCDAQTQQIFTISKSTGILTLFAGKGIEGSTAENVPALEANLHNPAGIAIDKAGNVYFTNFISVRKISVTTGLVTTVAGGLYGFAGDGGPATQAQMNGPQALAFDEAGNMFIADASNSRIRKVDAATGIINTIAGTGSTGSSGDGGPAINAVLTYPTAVSLDSKGNLYIADGFEIHRIRKIDVATGMITTIAGNGTGGFAGDGGPATAASLHTPLSIALDPSDNIYIGDYENHRIRKVAAATGRISTVAGKGPMPFIGEGIPATLAVFNNPHGMAVDKNNTLYIADYDNHRVRRIDGVTGTITTVAGNGTAGYSGDGGAATSAQLRQPTDVALAKNGDLLIAESDRVRKVDAVTGIITTIVGSGTSGFGGDGGPATAALLHLVKGIAVDANSNIIVTDYYNNRIRKIDAASGIITTIAGQGTSGFSGDGGPATAAALNLPYDLAIDKNNAIYFSDIGNYRIRKIDGTTGIISTVAGNGIAGHSGDGGLATAARIANQVSLALDQAGTIFFAQPGYGYIRKIDQTTGIISSVAGNGDSGSADDGIPATEASFYYPNAIAFDENATLYVADNNRIRSICFTPSLSPASASSVRAVNAAEGQAAVFITDCALHARIEPSGANPVSGTVFDSVWVEPTVLTVNGQPYVQRHYGFTPQQNAASATATLTLYFLQEDFTAYNAAPNHGLDLPIDAADADNNKANIRIKKRSGTSRDGTGRFDTYSGTHTDIVPSSVVWDSHLNAWAVTFSIEGFSGFFLTSASSTLPVTLVAFRARRQHTDVILDWEIAHEQDLAGYEIERSTNRRDFEIIGTVAAQSIASGSYQFIDKNSFTGADGLVYYRLKMVDIDSRFAYSATIAVKTNFEEPGIQVFPNPVQDKAFIRVNSLAEETLSIQLLDVNGRTVHAEQKKVLRGNNLLTVGFHQLAPGMYILKISGLGTMKELKLIKQP